MNFNILMKEILRKILSRKIVKNIRVYRRSKGGFKAVQNNEIASLKAKYKSVDLRQYKLKINSYEQSIYSQNGEDGVLLHIFSKIGVKNGKFVEFGAEDGRECNSANLSINFGWSGLLIDGGMDSVLNGREYYASLPQIRQGQIKFAHAWITKDNINKIIKGNGFKGDVDLLSVDIDGNDYHVLKAIDVINPRVIVVEYNCIFGDRSSVTSKYDAKFDPNVKKNSDRHYGASLAAMTKLANDKGYILVGCESKGVNAFFVRKDVAAGKMKEVSVKDAFIAKPFIDKFEESLNFKYYDRV